MTKPRKLRKITVTLFADQIEKLRELLAEHGDRNISAYLRAVIDKEVAAE